ncbi:MAG: alpha/beta hydrolase [Enhygromyxa sp.]
MSARRRRRPQPICRSGDNTLDTGAIPLIFVPGVMGSRLHFTADDEYWDPDSVWRMSHWLTTGAEKVRQEFTHPATVMNSGNKLSAEQCERGWAGVAKDFYVGFLQFLSEQCFGGYRTPVYAIGYDWRKDNKDSGDAVAERIEQILETEKTDRYILISHSMGGMVTRAALQQNPDTAAKLVGIIHVAQPVTGAAVLVRRMFTGARRSLDGIAMMLLLGGNRKKFQTIMSALTGPMELLCTDDYRDLDERGQEQEWWYTARSFEQPDELLRFQGSIWARYQQPVSPPGLLAPAGTPGAISEVAAREFRLRLTEAQAFHTNLGLWKHENTWSVFGTGHTCDLRVDFALPPREAKAKVIPSMSMAAPVVLYEAVRGNGETVLLQSGDVDPADRGVQTGGQQRREQSDSTVPMSSGAALFADQRHQLGDYEELEQRRQFILHGGQAHDKICNDAKIQRFVVEVINHLVGS